MHLTLTTKRRNEGCVASDKTLHGYLRGVAFYVTVTVVWRWLVRNRETPNQASPNVPLTQPRSSRRGSVNPSLMQATACRESIVAS